MGSTRTVEKTKGWEALCAVLTEKTQTEVANECEILQSSLSAIFNLHKKASLKEAVAFRKKFGIEPELWTQPISRRSRSSKGAA